MFAQLLSQPSISFFLNFLPAALVSVSSQISYCREFFCKDFYLQSGLFSLEALKEGLQGNLAFHVGLIFFKNWVIPSEVLLSGLCQSTQYLRLWLLPYGDRKAFVKFHIGFSQRLYSSYEFEGIKWMLWNIWGNHCILTIFFFFNKGKEPWKEGTLLSEFTANLEADWGLLPWWKESWVAGAARTTTGFKR